MSLRILALLLLATASAEAAQPQISATDDAVAKARDGLRSYSAPFYPPLVGNQTEPSTTIVDVHLDQTGVVTAVEAVSNPPILGKFALLASKSWLFEPTSRQTTRVKRITFVFEGERRSECYTGIVTNYQPPLTLHVTRLVATTRCLTRVDGRIPETRCPVHDEVMVVERLPIAYGLPSFLIREEGEPTEAGAATSGAAR